MNDALTARWSAHGRHEWRPYTGLI